MSFSLAVETSLIDFPCSLAMVNECVGSVSWAESHVVVFAWRLCLFPYLMGHFQCY